MSWTWGTLGDPALGAMLNAPMKALENYLGKNEKYCPVQGVARTTDATVTTLATYSVPVNTTVQIEGMCVARRTGGSGGSANDGAGYKVLAVCKNTSGTATVIGSSVTVVGESQAAWALTVDASGGDARVRVAGAANNNVTWAWSGWTLSVKD